MSQHRTGAGATINPDNIKMFYATAFGVGLVFASSVVISSFGLYAVGIAQGLPPHVAWVTPVMIDVSILVFTMAALIQKRRGNTFARVFASAGVGLATLLSVGLNFLHSYYTLGVADLKSATGTAVNTVAPLFIWVTTEMLVMLVTKQPPAPRAVVAPARKKATSTAKAGARKASTRTATPAAARQASGPFDEAREPAAASIPVPPRVFDQHPRVHEPQTAPERVGVGVGG